MRKMTMGRRVIPAALAVSLAWTVPAYAEEFVPGPGQPYDDATMARIQDNVLEYEEIGLLVDTYNQTLKNVKDTYSDTKNDYKDVDKLKNQIMEGSGSLADQAGQLSGMAGTFEDLLGYQNMVTPGTYAELVYSSEILAQQAEQMNVHFDSIVSATGSGGTYAGLTYGAKLYMPSTRSVGIGVCDDPFEEISYDLMCGIQELLESDVPVEKKDIHMHFHIGPGYAIPSEEGCAAVRRLARAEGILMDPVYTGKALAGFFQLLEEGYFDQDENILLLHSGGAGALFAVDLLAE